MKNKFFLIIIFFLALIPLVNAASPGHSAPAISPGTFAAGDYIFQSALNVSGNLYALNKFYSGGNLFIGNLNDFADGSNYFEGCSAGQYASDISVAGTLTCSTPTGGNDTHTHNAANITAGTFGSGNFAFQNNLTVDSTDLVVNANTGRVGIGTATPANTLNVVGDLNVTGISYLGNMIITADNITVNNIKSKDGNITFNDNSGNEKMRLTSAGKVGIGTANPSAKLDVESTSDDAGFFNATSGIGIKVASNSSHAGDFYSDSSVGVYSLSSSGYAGYFSSTSSRGIDAESASGTAAYFASGSGYGLIVASGNVGIGTATPDSTLDVHGNLNLTGNFTFGGTVSNNNLPRVRASIGTANTNVPINTWIIVNFTDDSTAPNFDNTNNWNTATRTFTAPIAGHYRIYSKVLVSQAIAAKVYNLAIYKNGADVIDSESYGLSGSSSEAVVQVEGILNLAVGDTISIYFDHNDVGATEDLNAYISWNFVDIEYLNGAQLSYIGQNLTVSNNLGVGNNLNITGNLTVSQRVGIGTEIPTCRLDIRGAAGAAGTGAAGDNGAYIQSGNGGTGQSQGGAGGRIDILTGNGAGTIGDGNAGNGGIINLTTGYGPSAMGGGSGGNMYLTTGSGSGAGTGGRILIKTGLGGDGQPGFIGIGTISPSAGIDIVGSVESSSAPTIFGNCTDPAQGPATTDLFVSGSMQTWDAVNRAGYLFCCESTSEAAVDTSGECDDPGVLMSSDTYHYTASIFVTEATCSMMVPKGYYYNVCIANGTGAMPTYRYNWRWGFGQQTS
jgi:hypothetical protein